ncbi:MAG TPA: hypothetical protein VM012_05435 [Flavitalea sp.]|nr:hypothetical protein [Flavitalea sp.]
MDRLAQLISKLKEQFEQNADPSELLATTQLIQQQLFQYNSPSAKMPAHSKVSVVLPSMRRSADTPVDEVEEVVALDVMHELPVEKKEAPLNGKKQDANGWLFDPLTEIPTLSHQEQVRELNELIGNNDTSLNDKLKEERIEIGHILTDSPIRDLKKAIGVNDRYLFISELFRGDEIMYERSIKTINAFRIYAEAEYWIERELKVKLGWDENRETTRHFHQLVRRRFS